MSKAFLVLFLSTFQVYQEVEQCCVALSERLDNQQYFFDDK